MLAGTMLAGSMLAGSMTLALTGCHDGEAATPPTTPTTPTTPTIQSWAEPPVVTATDDDAERAMAPGVGPGVDARDQYALAMAIQTARRTRDDRAGALARTRQAWIGRRYRWEVAFVPALCGVAGPCVVMPFDHHRERTHPIRQGWLPRLELTADQRAALESTCQAHARCVIELSGQLRQFELSTEQPTSLTLSEIQVHGARAATPSESWIRGMRRPNVRPMPRATTDRDTRSIEAVVASGLG
ncbi:MAG: hypothetical protein AAGF11_22690 [Myxococcota bacterium]